MQLRQEKHDLEIICHVGRYSRDTDFHWHENYEICQPVNGACDFLVNGETVSAKPGDLVVIERSAVHCFYPKEEKVNVRILQFSPRILFDGEKCSAALRTYIPREEWEGNPELAEWIPATFSLMEKERWFKKGEKNPLLRHLTLAMYLVLAKWFPGEVSSTADARTGDFRRIVEYINEHFREERLSVESLAKELFLPRGKVSAVFRVYAGIGVKDYMNSLRIDHVNRLLLEGWDVSRAALESGFGNLRTFNDVYRRHMGKSPSEYRLSFLKKR